MAYSFANNFTTTLSGNITSGATSLGVVSATGSPSSGDFVIMVYLLTNGVASNVELMLVTAGQGTNTWTVTRAQEGTAAVSHAAGEQVSQMWTKAGLDSLGSGYWPFLSPSGISGAVAATRYVGGTASGAPSSGGPFAAGDFVISQDGHVYVCTAPGSPGTWTTTFVGPGQIINSAHITGPPNFQTSSSSFVMVNAATALSIAAPASGKVLLVCSTVFNNSVSGVRFLMAWSQGTVDNTNISSSQAYSGSIDGERYMVIECEMDGLTPGAALTVGCQWAVTNVAGTVLAGNGQSDILLRAVAL